MALGTFGPRGWEMGRIAKLKANIGKCRFSLNIFKKVLIS